MQLDLVTTGCSGDYDDEVSLIQHLQGEFNCLSGVLAKEPRASREELTRAFALICGVLAGFDGHDWADHEEYSEFVSIQQAVLGQANERAIDLRVVAGEELFALAFER